MSVAIAGNAPTTFDLKGVGVSMLVLRLKSAAPDALRAELAERYGDIPDFFNGDLLALDLEPLQAAEPDATLDFAALRALLSDLRLDPLLVRGGSPAQMQAAQAAGWHTTDTVLIARRAPTPPAAPAPAAEAAPVPSTPQPASEPAHDAAHAHTPLPALVIDKPVRSGQQVYARGRDLVVLAMVNPGAEVIADGHIHVYAPLRGRAIAGARGEASARIFALEMAPELISIAGVYRTTDTPLAPEIWGKRACIRLASDEAGDKLVAEPLKG